MKRAALLTVILFIFCGCAHKKGAYPLFPLYITHFNDTHTAADEKYVELAFGGKKISVPSGGYARLAAAAKERGAQAPGGLVLFAGDAFQKGYILYETAGEEFDCRMLKEAGVDVMTVGNHEFDGGMAGFRRFLDCMETGGRRTDVVAANLTFDDPETASRVKPYVIRNVNGRRVGIVGLSVSDSFSMERIEGLGFLDSGAVSEKAVKELKKQNVDIIIFLTHQGFENDIKLAGTVDGIDVIVGGHSHTLQGDFSAFGIASAEKNYPLAVKSPSGGLSLVVTAFFGAKNIGILDVYFDHKGRVVSYGGSSRFLIGSGAYYSGGEPLPAGEEERFKAAVKSVPSFMAIDNDTSAEAVIKAFKDMIDPSWSGVKFFTEADLNTLRDAESPLKAITGDAHSGLGFHAASALLMEGRASGYEADAAVVNTGSMRRSLPGGNVTEGAFSEAVPYSNSVVVFSIKGSDLAGEFKRLLYSSVISGRVNAVPCAAGIKMRYAHDPVFEKASLTDIAVKSGGKWIPLDGEKYYKITMSSFLFEGGDGYRFGEAASGSVTTGYTDKEAFEAYLRLASPLKPAENTVIVDMP